MTEEEIVALLELYAFNYENDTPLVENAEYNALENRLRALNPNHEFLTKVGSEVRGGKIPLPYPMGSLDQVQVGELEKWVIDNGYLNEQFVITDKLDGVSNMNVYENGRFTISYSRGNGFEGADVTRHMKLLDIPKESPHDIVVRVETIIPISDFEFVKVDGSRVYKNPRNYVSGKMNASESPESFYKYTKSVATSIVYPKYSKLDQIEKLQELGYEVPHYAVVKGRDLTDEFLKEYLATRRENSIYEIDGLVIDLNDLELRSSSNKTNSSINPAYSKKYKVGAEDNIAIVDVVDVLWSPSKDGYLKPRVQIEPTPLGGVTISYCTGFNAKYIKDNGIGPGSVLQITRSGDVIPYIQKIITSTEPAMPDEEIFGKLVWSENVVDLIATESNDEIEMKKLEAFFSGIKVPNLKMGNIKQLYSAGFTSIEQIIKASQYELGSILGEVTGTKIYSGIKDKLTGISLPILSASSGLLGRGMGTRKMTALISHFGDNFLSRDLDYTQISKIDGFSELGQRIIKANHQKFLDFLESISGYYTLSEATTTEVLSSDLDGISFCFTGFRDEEAKKIIESKGGKVQDGVSKGLTYLVAKNISKKSSKLTKAVELGVKLISIQELKELISK